MLIYGNLLDLNLGPSDRQTLKQQQTATNKQKYITC